MATSELAATYASLILADESVEITGEKIHTLTSAAKVELEPIWASLLAKALAGKDVQDLLTSVGGGAASGPIAAAAPGAAGDAPAEEKKDEKKKEEKVEEESDDDMGFGLFD